MSSFFDRIRDRIHDKLTDPNVPVENRNAPAVADAIAREVAPVIRNATNAEPLHQSRVFLGSMSALIGAAIVIVDQLTKRQIDPVTLGPAIAVILGAGLSLYGRLRTGLKPLFSRRE